MRLLPYGEHAVLVETPDVLRLAAALRAVPGVVEVGPAARTVLVRFAPSVVDPRVVVDRALRSGGGGEPPAAALGAVDLPVRYDGLDLAAVAAETAMSSEAVVALHCGATYTVAFCGFAPGFAYLTGLDPSLVVARLSEPRPSVPAGSVGVAGEFTGVYPRASPGGWRLLGRTDVTLWDPNRTPPALLVPGTTVRFVPS